MSSSGTILRDRALASLGVIEMTTGLTPAMSITSLKRTLSSFGASALGQNLSAQAAAQNVSLILRRDLLWSPLPITVRDQRTALLAVEGRCSPPPLTIETGLPREAASAGSVPVGYMVEIQCDPPPDVYGRAR